ncbi:MAG: ParM/StbA family protein [Carnobacterium alterfunditum]
MRNSMEMTVGIDIGNAKTEVAYSDKGELKFVRQPSVYTYLTEKPDNNDNDEAVVMNQLFDNLLVHAISGGLRRQGQFYIGNKALDTPDNVINMPIELGSKSEHDIPLLMSFSLLAAIAAKKYYNANNEIPSSLSVEVKMATAIPSSEYNKQSAQRLESRFLGKHKVTLEIGDSSVLVLLTITHCKVTEEGKTSMLAFLNSDPSILSDYNKTYEKEATPADFSEALSLHADIGDGTSEIVFTKGFNPVTGGSRGLRVGVGHATTNAIKLYKQELGNSTGEITRQHFAQTLKGKNEKAELARDSMKRATVGQALKIMDKIIEGFASITTSSADYFFVHGGGSIAFKDDLYYELLDFASRVRGEVVWIPEQHATTMNSKGTYYLAQYLFSDNN